MRIQHDAQRRIGIPSVADCVYAPQRIDFDLIGKRLGRRFSIDRAELPKHDCAYLTLIAGNGTGIAKLFQQSNLLRADDWCSSDRLVICHSSLSYYSSYLS